MKPWSNLFKFDQILIKIFLSSMKLIKNSVAFEQIWSNSVKISSNSIKFTLASIKIDQN